MDGRPWLQWLASLMMGSICVSGCGIGTGPEIEVDHVAMREVEGSLLPLAPAFDALPTPPGAISDGPSEFDGCSEDSGEVLQPSVVRSWTFDTAARSRDPLEPTPRALAAGHTVAEAMVRAGWEITEPMTPGSWIALERGVDDSTVDATINVYDDAMYLAAELREPLPCQFG